MSEAGFVPAPLICQFEAPQSDEWVGKKLKIKYISVSLYSFSASSEESGKTLSAKTEKSVDHSSNADLSPDTHFSLIKIPILF